jgi:hypothetical protein
MLPGKTRRTDFRGDDGDVGIMRSPLRAIVLPKSGAYGPGNMLFFTAGPDEKTNCLFGSLNPIAAELNENDEQ